GQLPEADLAGLAQRVADDAKCFLGEFISGRDEIRRVEVKRRNLCLIDELYQFEGLAGFELDGVDLFVAEEDIVALLVLEALPDVVAILRTHHSDYLLVADRLAGGFVNQTETGFGARLGGGVDFDRNGNQRQPELAFPD